jgi:hypothetical protein
MVKTLLPLLTALLVSRSAEAQSHRGCLVVRKLEPGELATQTSENRDVVEALQHNTKLDAFDAVTEWLKLYQNVPNCAYALNFALNYLEAIKACQLAQPDKKCGVFNTLPNICEVLIESENEQNCSIPEEDLTQEQKQNIQKAWQRCRSSSAPALIVRLTSSKSIRANLDVRIDQDVCDEKVEFTPEKEYVVSSWNAAQGCRPTQVLRFQPAADKPVEITLNEVKNCRPKDIDQDGSPAETVRPIKTVPPTKTAPRIQPIDSPSSWLNRNWLVVPGAVFTVGGVASLLYGYLTKSHGESLRTETNCPQYAGELQCTPARYYDIRSSEELITNGNRWMLYGGVGGLAVGLGSLGVSCLMKGSWCRSEVSRAPGKKSGRVLPKANTTRLVPAFGWDAANHGAYVSCGWQF